MRLPHLSQRQVTAAVIAVCAVLGTALAVVTRDEPGRVIAEGVELAEADPFAFEQEDADEFLERGSRGLSHPLYTLSPGGVEATAERTLRFEDEIAAAAEDEGVDPSTLEALVFLESAGRPDVIAGDSPDAAAGLAQILPETATDLLDMSVNLERSKELTRAIARQEARAEAAPGEQQRLDAERQARALAAERSRVDERFDPEAAPVSGAR
jgi:Transglycosylase SLT domain